MDVSIIIVNYNTKELTKNCLQSIYQQTKDVEFEVIVSDNGSADGSVGMIKDLFPSVVLVENNANLGFGAANNRGLEVAKGKYVLYLNSDTVLLNNAVKIFFDYFEAFGEKESLGVLGGSLYSPEMLYIGCGGKFMGINHELKVAFIDFLRIQKNSFFPKKNAFKSSNKANEFSPYRGVIDYVYGCDMFLKNDQMAKFDERFFMYREEEDLQLQIFRANKKAYILDEPKIIHYDGASSRINKNLSVMDYYRSFSKLNTMVSSVLFAKKNYNAPIRVFVLKMLVFFSMLNFRLYPASKKYLKKIWSF